MQQGSGVDLEWGTFDDAASWEQRWKNVLFGFADFGNMI